MSRRDLPRKRWGLTMPPLLERRSPVRSRRDPGLSCRTIRLRCEYPAPVLNSPQRSRMRDLFAATLATVVQSRELRSPPRCLRAWMALSPNGWIKVSDVFAWVRVSGRDCTDARPDPATDQRQVRRRTATGYAGERCAGFAISKSRNARVRVGLLPRRQ